MSFVRLQLDVNVIPPSDQDQRKENDFSVSNIGVERLKMTPPRVVRARGICSAPAGGGVEYDT